MKNFTKNRKKGGNAGIVAIVGLFLLGGWGNAEAQFVENDLGYTVVHTSANAGLSNFDMTSSRTWSAQANNTVVVADQSGQNGTVSFLTLKETIHKIPDSGTYTVELSRFDKTSGKEWHMQHGFAVFRYTANNSFYAVAIGQNQPAVYFYTNGLSNDDRVTLNRTGGKDITDVTTKYTITVLMGSSNKFKISVSDGANTATYEHTPTTSLTSGQVGYAHSSQNERCVEFHGSSWTDAYTPESVPTGYSGYYVWNTKAGATFTGGGGDWSGTFWSNANSGTLDALPSGYQNVLFYAEPGGTITRTTGTSQVANMAFEVGGYNIARTGTTALLSLHNTGGSTIKVVKDTATISTVINGITNGFTKTGVGTLILSGANTYTAPTTVSAGRLVAKGIAALSNDGASGNATAITIDTGAKLEIDVDSAATDTVLNLRVTGDTLTKTGTGKLVFSGTVSSGNTSRRKEVNVLNVAAGTLAVLGDAVVTVSNSFTMGASTTLRVGLGNTLGPPAVTLGTTVTLNITGTLPAAETDYTLFGGTAAVSGTFSAVQVNGTAWTKVSSANRYYSAAGDTISMDYTAGVKYTFIPKGGGEPTTYTLTVNRAPTTGGGVAVTVGTGTAQNNPSAALTLNKDTSVSVTATPSSGSKFVNWTAAAGTSLPAGVTATDATITFTMVGNVNITANFTDDDTPATTFTLTVNVNPTGGGSVTPTSKTGIEAGEEVEIAATPDDGYEFVNWTVVTAAGTVTIADATAAATTVTLSNNATIRANFKLTDGPPPPETYTITFDATGGTVEPLFAMTDEEGKLASLPTPTKEGYNFYRWVTAAEGGDAVTLNTVFDGNATIYAQWTEKLPEGYLLTTTVSPVSAGTISRSREPDAGTGRYPEGASVNIVANSSSPDVYTFSHWEVNGATAGGAADTTIVMDSNKEVVAHFSIANVAALTIDTAEYIDTSYSFKVAITLEKSLEGRVIYELVRGQDTVAKKEVGITGNRKSDTIVVNANRMLYDTTYVLSAHVVTSGGDIISSTGTKPVTVGEFKVQRFTFTGGGMAGAGGVVRADNDRFRLDTYDSLTSGSVLVEALSLPAVSESFIALGKGYRYKMSGVDANGVWLPPFAVSIKLERGELTSKAAGYGVGDVRLYRYADGGWQVVRPTPTKYDSVSGGWYFTGKGVDKQGAVMSDTGVYRIMINKAGPKVSIGSSQIPADSARKSGYYRVWKSSPADSALIPGYDKIEVANISITTNVTNTTTKVLYAAARATSTGAAPNWVDTVKVRWGGATFSGGSILIPGTSIETTNQVGVLVYLIIDNGSVSDTINLSRRVRVTDYAIGSSAGDRWSPFGAKVNLTDKTIDAPFKDKMFDDADEKLPVDDKTYRLFRWLPKTDPSAGGAWTEYAGEESKELFQMQPGRLMWLRTQAKITSFDVGAATTASLTDTFNFADALKANQWTDFILPFDFGVKVKDVLAATTGSAKTDKLYFYAWNNTDGSGKEVDYSGAELFDKENPFDSEGYINYTDDAALRGPFTVFNGGSERSLRVPPKPAFLSGGQFKKANPLAKAAAGGGFWYYAINASLDGASNIASLKLGYHDLERMIPAPPTLGNRSVALVSDDGGYMGYYLTPELAKGGRIFKLRFTNGDRQKAVFKFTAETGAGVPEKTQIMFVDAQTGEILGGSGSERSVTVAANSHTDVYAVVGSRDYLNKTVVGPSGAKFAMGGVSVNRAARTVRVKYYVPLAGTDRVEMSVYNLKGRLVWKNAERVKKSSWNTMEWRARESRGGAAAAGLYIIRIRAMNVNGKTTAIENRKITFAR